jgi:hypothetical protein
MRKIALCALVLALVAILPARLHPLTQMVAVQIDVGQAALSPNGLERARNLATDLEDAFMDQLFEAGHITFNARPQILLAGDGQSAVSVENLLSQAKNGGATLLVYCRLGLTEPVPNRGVAVDKVSVSAVPIHTAAGFPVTWTLPTGNLGGGEAFRAGVKRLAVLLVAKLADLSATIVSSRF